jgi:hypothetical protein
MKMQVRLLPMGPIPWSLNGRASVYQQNNRGFATRTDHIAGWLIGLGARLLSETRQVRFLPLQPRERCQRIWQAAF